MACRWSRQAQQQGQLMGMAAREGSQHPPAVYLCMCFGRHACGKDSSALIGRVGACWGRRALAASEALWPAAAWHESGHFQPASWLCACMWMAVLHDMQREAMYVCMPHGTDDEHDVGGWIAPWVQNAGRPAGRLWTVEGRGGGVRCSALVVTLIRDRRSISVPPV